MMIASISLSLHALLAAAWVGGMFFAYMVLRHAVPGLEAPPERLKLWARVFKKFFPWVWMAVLVLPLTGYALIFGVHGGFAGAGMHIHVMHLTGWVMILLYIYLQVGPYKAFKAAVEAETWPEAAKALDGVRRIVAINLLIGIVTLAVGAGGRYWTF